ncbi:hypothetical protein M885DRAFT_618581 [Pelagophyceae sp. CCMP2097]|nr:hypothetical protein M885DRAFT_618581 [Pelagophyceae sp. CCMP2097]
MRRPGAALADDGGAFLRVRTPGFAVEYAGVKIGGATTAADAVSLVAEKLRLSEKHAAARRLVMVYAGDARRGAPWRVRTLQPGDALLALRREAVARLRLEAAESAQVDGDDVRFFLHESAAAPLDVELGGDASGSSSSEDERPPFARYVGDRGDLEKRAKLRGTLLKRSDKDPNLWRRRHCVLANDRLWYWRDDPRAPGLAPPAPPTAPPQTSRRAGSAVAAALATPKAPLKEDSDRPGPALTPLELETAVQRRATAACVSLASNGVREVANRRDAPLGFEIATASHSYVFRANSRTEQLEKRRAWLDALRRSAAHATENEYLAMAELLIADERRRITNAENRAERAAADAEADGAASPEAVGTAV